MSVDDQKYCGDAKRGAWITLFVVAVLTLAGPAGCAPADQDDTVGGPEWRTGLRTLVGSATALSPARLTGIEAKEHRGFDRISFSFEGPLPGYLVGYRPDGDGDGDGDGDQVLMIVLEHAQVEGRRQMDCDLPAVAEISRGAADGESVRTTVTTKSGRRLAFRLGISLDAVYVDLAHPGESGDSR